MQNNDYIKIKIEDFITNATKIRCCGSCMGGCQDPCVCFICAGYTGANVNNYYNENPEAKERVQRKIEAFKLREMQGYEKWCLKERENL